MPAKGYMLGQSYDQIQNQSISKFPSLSHLGENGLRHFPAKDKGDTLNDWRQDTRISRFREFIRNKISETSIALETNHQWGQGASNVVTWLENHLFMEAASQEEYMNQETLVYRLHNIIRRKFDDSKLANHLTSSSLPICMTLPSLGMSNGCCYSDALHHPVNCFNDASSECKMIITDKTDQFNFLEGSLINGYNGGGDDVVNACDGKYMSSPVGVRQVASETVLSPEQTSSITTYSNEDWFSDVGPVVQYNSEATFGPFQQQPFDQGEMNLMEIRGSVGNNQNVHSMVFPSTLEEILEFSKPKYQIPQHAPQKICEVSNNLVQSEMQMLESQQNHQQSHQPYLQSDEPLKAQSQSYLVEQYESSYQREEQFACRQPELPSEQSHRVQNVTSECSELPFSSKDTAGNSISSNLSQFFVEHKILLAYVKYKSTAVPLKESQVSFANYLHLTVCIGRTCFCERYCVLLSHFDDCHYADCHICGPVRQPSVTNELLRKFEKAKRGILRDSDGLSSDNSEDVLPPSKRLKMENHFCPFLFENGTSQVLAPSLVQSCAPERLPNLQQSPESPVSMNSEVTEVNKDHFMKPIQDPSCIIRDNVGDKIFGLNSDSIPFLSGELIVGHKPEEIDPANICEIADNNIDNSDRLRSKNVPVLPEELSNGHKEEDVMIGSESDQKRPEIENDLIALESDHEKGIEPENAKMKGVSLIESFAAEKIREHISSLRQWIGQSISKEERGNKATHTISENPCKLCTANKLYFVPPPIYCSSCGNPIKRSVNYYCTVDARYCFCTSCYKKSRGGSITFYGIAISKANLEKKKNVEEAEELWVQCDKCEGRQHQICALYNKRDLEGKAEYICPICCLKELETGDCMPLPKSTIFGAKDLPSTMLSNHIEQRLFRRLKQEREERSEVTGKNLDDVPGAEDLVVRVVSSVDKQLKVKKQFLDIFHNENYPSEFPYRSKVILLFQKIEGVDVCLFGMYVQEFGSECGQPNQRCVYISYLDSVKLFRPETVCVTGEALRTFVYHEILIGYLDYCKKRGFATCYIWACPPVKGEEYILYCHPVIQKTPKPEKLRQWYQSMLRKAAKEKIVVAFTNLYDYFFAPTGECNTKVTAARLPYFDGDYWSGAAEDVIRSIEQESGGESQRKMKKVMTKRTLKAMGHTNPSDGAAKDILLMQKLGQTILPVKEDFIIIHLQFICTRCLEVILSGGRWFCNQCKNFQLCERCHEAEQNSNRRGTHTLISGERHLLSQAMVDDVPSNTKDKDVNLDNGLFENRHAFLSLCQKNHYQFDTLRRAKHSSMMILHHLHNPTVLNVGNACCICHKEIVDQSWLCEICPEFVVCVTCYQEKGGSCHIHKLTRSLSTANHGTESKTAQQKSLLTRKLLDVLAHVSQCCATKSHPCTYPNCLQIRRLLHHAKKCNIRVAGGCQHCKKAWLVLRTHSRNCRESDCAIPRCMDLKKHAEWLALQSESRRRAAVAELVGQQAPEVAENC